MLLPQWMLSALETVAAGDLRALLGFGVEHDALVLFVVGHDAAQEDVECLGAALFDDLVAGLVKVLGDLIGGGFLLVDDFGYHSVASGINGPADGADRKLEQLRGHLGYLTEVGNLSIAADEVAGLDGCAHLLGSLRQVVFGLGLVSKLLSLGAKQAGEHVVAIILKDVVFPVGEGGGVGGLDTGDLEDGIAFAGGCGLRRIALLGFKRLGEDLSSVGQRGDDALTSDGRRGDNFEMVSGGGLFESVFGGFRGEGGGVILFRRGGFLADEGCLNGGQHLADVLLLSRLALFHLQDVVAELALHNGNVADFLAEESLLKLRHGCTLLIKAELAPCIFAAVVGVLFGQVGKVRAGLELLEDIFCPGLGGGIRFGIGTRGDLEQDVTRPCLFLGGVFVLVSVVVGLNILLRGLGNSAGNVIGSEGEVGDFALLSDGARVTRGVLFEEGFKVAVTGVDGLAKIVGGDDGVVELDLDVALALVVADFFVAYRNAAGDECLEAANGDVVLNLFLELRHGHLEACGDQIRILVVTNVLAAGVENLAGRARLEVGADIVHGCVDAELVGFLQQYLLLDKLLADALLKHIENDWIVGIALLRELGASLLLNLGLGDG